MASGARACGMGSACGRNPMAIIISDSGKIIKRMGRVCIPGKMGIDMKENGKLALNTGKELKNSLMVKSILEIIKQDNLMELENILGPMEIHLKENLNQV